MTGLLVACVVLLTLAVVALVIGIVLLARRLRAVARTMEDTLRSGRDDISAVSRDIHQSLSEADNLMRATREQVGRVDRILTGVENFAEGRTIVDAAEKAVSSSRVTLLAAMEGVKQGLKALRSSSNKSKEEANDEQRT